MVIRKFRNVLAAMAARIAPGAYKRRRLGRQLTVDCRDGFASAQPGITVTIHQRRFAEPNVAEIHRKRNRISVFCDSGIYGKTNLLLRRLSPIAPIVARAPLQRLQLVADISMCGHYSAGVLSPCSSHPDAILIPDEYFVASRGFEEFRLLARRHSSDWNNRSNAIVWRGSTNGVGTVSKDVLSANDPGLIPRVRLCLEMKGAPDSDVKLNAVTQLEAVAIHTRRLSEAGIFGEFVSPLAWFGLKFAIDIDGQTNAWSNFFTRLLMGCCVLKVESELGFRQWYYDEIKPWVHYVPVRADFSDLHARIAWCRANLGECRAIAARGQEFAMAHDYETELTSAIRRVCEAYKSGALRRAAQ